jgi:glycosyltransferase involved in cell wall biosynthesis
MVVHSYFPADPRVRKEASALSAAGHDVDVICLRGAGEPPAETCGAIGVRRSAVSRRRSRGRLGYVVEYASFFIAASVALARLDREKRIDVVHVHNIPDQLVYAAFVPRWRGARVVLDMHDPMPELFVDKYGLAEDSRMRRLLIRLQSACCDYADHVIVSSEPLKELLVRRGTAPERVSVVINGPERAPRADPFVMVYHGSLFDRYGLETVLHGMALAGPQLPSAELLVFGSDTDPAYVARLRALAEELGVAGRVSINGRIDAAAVRCTLDRADLGLVPARRSPHIDLVYSTKLLDYLAAGLPVLAARTPPIERRFGDAVRYYEPEDAEGFALGMLAAAADRHTETSPRASLLPPSLRWDAIAPTVVRAVTGVSALDAGVPKAGSSCS